MKLTHLDYVDMELIRTISEYNNFVDTSSREYLYNYIQNNYDPNALACSKVIDPILDFDPYLYSQLTKKTI